MREHIDKVKNFKSFINENRNYKDTRIKYDDINLDNLIGLKPSDFYVFSDKGAFEYHYDVKSFYGKIIDIGGDLYYLDYSGKYHRIPNIIYDIKTKSYQYNNDISDREKKYGKSMPKSGGFNVIHGSPYGKIDKFDEKMFGMGYQREELPHERFAGVYVSDDTKENKILNRGYGDVHDYYITFNNSIWEEDARKLLIKHEKEIEKRLNRIEATNYIKSLGYDLVYRKFEDSDNMEYVVLDINKIK